jgi:hypothetical protein
LNLQLSLVSSFKVSWFHPNRDRDRYRDRLFNHGTRRTHGKAWLFFRVFSVFRGSNQKLRSAPNRCGADLNGNQCLRGFAQNLHAQLLFLGLTRSVAIPAGVQCSIDGFAAVCAMPFVAGGGFRRRIQSVPQRPHKSLDDLHGVGMVAVIDPDFGRGELRNASGDYKPDRVAELVSDVAPNSCQLQQHAELITLGDVWRRKNFYHGRFLDMIHMIGSEANITGRISESECKTKRTGLAG